MPANRRCDCMSSRDSGARGKGDTHKQHSAPGGNAIVSIPRRRRLATEAGERAPAFGPPAEQRQTCPQDGGLDFIEARVDAGSS